MAINSESVNSARGTVSVLRRLVSPFRAYRILKEITLFHRFQGSPGLVDAARRMEELILELGPDIVETELIEYTNRAGPEWLPLPAAWSVESAVLIVGDREYRLEAHPTLAVAHAPPSDGWVEGEVVAARDPLDPSSYSEKDKIYLVTEHHTIAYRIAAEQGVAAIIMAKSSARPDAFPAIDLFLTPREISKYSTPALTAPWREASQLEGKNIRMKVDATLGEHARLPVVAAWIGDRNDPGPLVMGHLCHPAPGANDNASGAASSVEAFIALAEAIDEGRLNHLEGRTVRLLLMPEWTGTVLSMEGWLGSLATAGVNLDMVGAGNWARVAPPRILYPPLTAPKHRLADTMILVASLAELDMGLRYYMFGSDHDILMAYGRESVMVNQWPDPQYHSDLDDADKIDPSRLAVASIIGAASVYLYGAGAEPPVSWARRVVEDLVLDRLREGDEVGARLAGYYAAMRYGVEPITGLPEDWRPPAKEGELRLRDGKRLVLTVEPATRGDLDAAIRLARLLSERDDAAGIVRGETIFAALRKMPVGGFLTLVAAAYGVEASQWVADRLGELVELGVVEVSG